MSGRGHLPNSRSTAGLGQGLPGPYQAGPVWRKVMHQHQHRHQPRPITRGLLIAGSIIAVTGLGAGLTLKATAGDNPRPPSNEQVASAERTSNLLLATLFAALT